MSIAVSVIVGPSRVYRLLHLGCGLALGAAAFAVGLGAPDRFPAALALATMLAGTGVILMRAAARPPKTHRIDISGTGELRVTVQQDVGGAESVAGVPMALSPGSVLWPVLAVLRYRPVDASGVHVPGAAAGVLAVWRDSVDPAAWRALAVALAVIGRRQGGAGFDKIR